MKNKKEILDRINYYKKEIDDLLEIRDINSRNNRFKEDLINDTLINFYRGQLFCLKWVIDG